MIDSIRKLLPYTTGYFLLLTHLQGDQIFWAWWAKGIRPKTGAVHPRQIFFESTPPPGPDSLAKGISFVYHCTFTVRAVITSATNLKRMYVICGYAAFTVASMRSANRSQQPHPRRVRSYVPRVLCSPGPMFPRTYVPRVRCSPILCSPVPMFPGTCEPLSYVPRYLCSPVLCSPVPMFPVPMFPGTYVPPYLCSPVSPLTIMPSTYVPHP